jgi:hypothetical protein
LRAESLIKNNKGVLYKRSIGILKVGLRLASNGNMADLKEFVPIFERKYLRMKARLDRKLKEEKDRYDQQMAGLIKNYSLTDLKKQLVKLER